MGKTRLALHPAERCTALFPGGVAFVPLAETRDPALLLPVIARALGIDERDGASLVEQLAEQLADHPFLLVLDNLEQLLPAAGATTLVRSSVDQAALYGLLIQLRDLGLVLLAVEQLDSS